MESQRITSNKRQLRINCGFEGNQMEIKTTAEIKYSVDG